MFPNVKKVFDLRGMTTEEVSDFIDKRLGLDEKKQFDLSKELTKKELGKLIEILEKKTDRRPTNCFDAMLLKSRENLLSSLKEGDFMVYESGLINVKKLLEREWF